MTTFKERGVDAGGPATGMPTRPASSWPGSPSREVLEIFAGGRLPLRFTAYDGSSAGPLMHRSAWT